MIDPRLMDYSSQEIKRMAEEGSVILDYFKRKAAEKTELPTEREIFVKEIMKRIGKIKSNRCAGEDNVAR